MKGRQKIKGIIKYLSSVISWSLFVVLLLCALALGYYYVSMQISKTKGKGYEPPFSIYTIVSGSMIPNIKVYDVVINFKVDSPTDIKKGDVITFISTSSISVGKTVTHRVNDIQIVNGKYQFITKGDNNLSTDGAPALYENVIGKAVIRLPQLGRIQFFVAKSYGWLLVVVVPALIIIIEDVLKLIKLSQVKKDAQKVNSETMEDNKNES